MTRETRYGIILLCSSLFLMWVIGEGVVRWQGEFDQNGNFRIGSRNLRPYKLPLEGLKTRLEAYESNQKNSYIAYQPEMGWIPNPNFLSLDGRYCHNSVGIRSDSIEYSIEPTEKTIRIALIGDSHIYGKEVKNSESLGVQLGQLLHRSHPNVEIINFGTGGFGMDQAFLRWLHQAKDYKPDVVIFGFQPENAFRNTNLVRTLYNLRAGNPFTKPRFIIEDDDLKLINSPTLEPNAIPDVIEDIEQWNLMQHESFYAKDDFESSFWFQSKLISYLYDLITYNRFNIKEQEKAAFQPDTEAYQVTVRLIQKMNDEITASGSQFLMVHIPRKGDLEDWIHGKEFDYQELLDTVVQIAPMIRTEATLAQAAEQYGIDSLFAPKLHFSGTAHREVALLIEDFFATSEMWEQISSAKAQ